MSYKVKLAEADAKITILFQKNRLIFYELTSVGCSSEIV